MIPTDPNSLKFKKAKFKNKAASTAKAGEYAIEVVNGSFNLVADGTAAPIPEAPASVADTTLSGTPKVFVVYDGETPYYFKAYPTKA